MGRIIISVIAGYAAIGIMVVLTDQVAALAIPGFSNMTTPPAFYFCASLATDTLYALAGGYVCAMIARDRLQRATVALIVFGEIVGVVSQVVLWTTVPHWFGLTLLVTYPPAVWFGSKLRAANRTTTASRPHRTPGSAL